jgi:hypothetical protein
MHLFGVWYSECSPNSEVCGALWSGEDRYATHCLTTFLSIDKMLRKLLHCNFKLRDILNNLFQNADCATSTGSY